MAHRMARWLREASAGSKMKAPHAAAAEKHQHAILLAETDEQAKLIGSPNQVEAVRANLEKRAPQFVG